MFNLAGRIAFLTFGALAPVTPGIACTVVAAPLQPPNQEQIDRYAREMVRDSVAVMEVITTRTVTSMEGSARILQVLKGKFQPGRIISVGAVGSAACGPDMIPAGSRGFILVRDPRERIYIGNFLEPRYLESMKRQGLLASAGL